MSELTSDSAKELSKLGAAKGGRARASVLTADERREIARNAVATRWAKYKDEKFPPAPQPKETTSAPEERVVYQFDF